MVSGKMSFILRRELGRRIRTYRIQRDMTQEQLAWAADVTQGAISNYETGRHEVPLSVLLAVCAALDVSPLELVPILDRVPGSSEPPRPAVAPVEPRAPLLGSVLRPAQVVAGESAR